MQRAEGTALQVNRSSGMGYGLMPARGGKCTFGQARCQTTASGLSNPNLVTMFIGSARNFLSILRLRDSSSRSAGSALCPIQPSICQTSQPKAA
jgi:hypothetical protein